MLFKIIFIILLLVALYLYIRHLLDNYHFKYDFITVFEGSLGSGKTTMIAYHVKRVLKRRRRSNIFRFIVNIFLPKRWKLDYKCEEVYSDFPLYLGKKFGWAKVLDENFMYWAYKLPKGSIIALDELAFIFPNSNRVSTDLERFTSIWLRHVLGDSFIFAGTQSMSEVAIFLRRRLSHVYHLSNMRKGFFKSRVNVIDVLMSEDIVNVYQDSVKNFKENIFKFKFPKNMFISTYGSSFYELSYKDRLAVKNLSDVYDKYKIKVLTYWDNYYYDNQGVRIHV